jgi:hypothetical protein
MSDEDIEDLDVLDVQDDLDLQDKWLSSYINKEKKFNKFYKEEIKTIDLFFLYVDKHNHIIKVVKEKFEITDNILLKKNVKTLISENCNILNKKFKIIEILKYNCTVDNKVINNTDYASFLTKINSISDIYWENTIPIFYKLNSLHFIFYEKSKGHTKKIFLRKKKSKTKKKNIEMQIEKSDIIDINSKKQDI